MTRSELRENVFRALFRYDFYELEDFEAQTELFLSEYPQEDEDETWPKMSNKERGKVAERIGEIKTKVADVDQAISKNLTGWTIERVGKAELAILRIAVYEILYDEGIDTAISIDEAVNLAKKYCDEKSPAFVNGILAKFASKESE